MGWFFGFAPEFEIFGKSICYVVERFGVGFVPAANCYGLEIFFHEPPVFKSERLWFGLSF